MNCNTKCVECGKEIVEHFNGFCDLKCHGRFHGKKSNLIDYGNGECKGCKNTFRKKSTNQLYCSIDCRKVTTPKTSRLVQKEYSCVECGEIFTHPWFKKYCPNCPKKVKKAKNKTQERKFCERCNAEIDRNKTSRYKYCSYECRYPKEKCEHCSKIFIAKKKHTRFCSTKCYNDSQAKSHEKYVEEFFSVHKGTIVPLELYKGSDHIMKAKCLNCGDEFERVARVYIGVYKRGCPKCNNKSHGENSIQTWLETNNLDYKKQFSFDDLRYYRKLYYDFAILNNDEVVGLIEFDGIQHFEPIKRFGGDEKLRDTILRDEIKNNYAKAKGIPLLRISYKEKDKMNVILNKFIYKSLDTFA